MDKVDRVKLARQIGRAEAVAQERERLRPLLERCAAVAEALAQGTGVVGNPEGKKWSGAVPLLAALRAELGKE